MISVNDVHDAIMEGLGISSIVQNLTAGYIIAALLCATACGVVIYFIYRFFYRGVVYSDNFNILLVFITVITSFIIMTISANIVISLGMVGALSIVRFRAAIKDPLDLGFLFWAIAAGLTCGAGLYLPAFMATAFIAVLYIIMTFVKKERKNYLLIVRHTDVAQSNVDALLNAMKYKLKSKTVSGSDVELTIEIKIKRNNSEHITRFNTVEGVMSVTLLEYTGEYMN